MSTVTKRIVMGGYKQLGMPKPPLTMNQRLHWQTERQLKKDLRELTVNLCRIHRIPRGATHVRVELHYRPATRNYPDPINLTKTLKTCVDALQPPEPAYRDKNGALHPQVLGYGLIPNDDRDHADQPTPIVHDCEGKEKSLWWLDLTITYGDKP